MLRAVWTAAEILSGYQEDIESFELETGDHGDFEFWLGGKLIYSRRQEGKFPELRDLKQAVVAAIDAARAQPAAGS